MSQQYMDCPGCGKPDVPRVLVACFKCWPKLPLRIRSAIRNTSPGGMARIRAIASAREWYSQNKRS